MHSRAWPRSDVQRGHVFGRRRWLLAMALACGLGLPCTASASHDPNLTATIYVMGFDPHGVDRQGVFGDDIHEPLADSVAALAGLPVSHDAAAPLPPNAVVGTDYYGDIPPSYYSAADIAEIDQITATWGGGVPRYALIVARHARRVMERSGAQQVNFVSASFGSLIVRWLIEKNVEGLAGEGRIARWLSIEGLLGGNWAASHDQWVDLVGLLEPTPVDLTHMSYDWIETHLHAPRTEAASSAYGGILVGQIGSTDDSYNSAALRGAMLAYGEYQPNDGVQGLRDAAFGTMTTAARFQGRMPTMAVFHATHPGLESWRVAWGEAAAFLTAARRVTITMTEAQVTNLHEVQLPFWDWTPAEVLWESRVYSPAWQISWAIGQPRSAYVKEGAAAPLIRYDDAGDTRTFQHVMFDGLVLPQEAQLRVELRPFELDYDPRYGVFETGQTPYHDDMGGGGVTVSTLQSGTYTVTTPDWNGHLTVTVQDYAFATFLGVDDSGVGDPARALAIVPNPSGSSVRIVVPFAPARASDQAAMLEISDVAGRLVRRIEGPLRGGFSWDGRDTDGRLLPAGVYLHRVTTRQGVWRGRSCLLR